jgi:CRP/FNR family transcriptional regulator
MIPADTFRSWIHRYDGWRSFVFDLLSQRLSIMMTIVDEVAFRRLDTRVAGLLLERGRDQNPIPITHQEIAAELGSSREVVSRILEDFATQNLTRSMRGAIEILDKKSLQARSTT